MFFKVIFHFQQCFLEGFFIDEHAFQIQPFSRCRFGYKLPVTCPDYLRCFCAVPSSLADFEYVCNEYPHHVVEEAGADDDEVESVFCPDEVEAVDMPHFVLDFGFGTREAREVMCTNEVLHGFTHALFIEGIGVEGFKAVLERVPVLSLVYPVPVRLPL